MFQVRHHRGYVMHLSMSTPSPLRTGLGGRYRGFEIVKLPDPGGDLTINLPVPYGSGKGVADIQKRMYIIITLYPQDCITNIRSEGPQHSTALRSRPRCMYTYERSSYIEHSSLVGLHVPAFLSQSLFWLFL